MKRAIVCLLALAASAAAERWELQYFYDQDKSTLAINDIRFVSPQRGVAVGVIVEGKHTRPMSVVTSDGGRHWTQMPTREIGVSLFFLNENVGWMVTSPRGLYLTTEAGRNWKKLPDPPKGLFRVHFLDEKHGFGVGMRKTMVETTDGGLHWKPVAAAAEPNTRVETTAYTWITFTGLRGNVAGYSMPLRSGEEARPDWIDPDSAMRRAERPHLTILLQSADGGRKWRPSVSSMFGRITRFRQLGDGSAFALIEGAYTWPAELHRLDGRSGEDRIVYRDKARAVTDFAVDPQGSLWLAGIEVLGRLPKTLVPGKLKMIRGDSKKWTEVDVDYRATASRATLSLIDERNVWVATDTGMILKLVP